MKHKIFIGLFVPGLIGVVLLLVSCATPAPQYKQAESLYLEGQELRSQGENEAALQKFETSYTLSKEEGYLAGMAHNLNEMAMIHSARGEGMKARELLTEAFVLYSQEGMTQDVSKTLNNMALTYLREGNFKGAVKKYQELVVWDRRTENLQGVAVTMHNMGRIYEQHLRQPLMARRSYLEALAIFTELGEDTQRRSVEQSLRRLN